MSEFAAIIPAAGSGTRMGLEIPKQFYLLAGEPILIHTVRKFVTVTCIELVVVVVPGSYITSTKELLGTYGLLDENVLVVAGGKRRQDSVQCGLNSLPKNIDVVLVHDGARPFITTKIIESCAQAARKSGAAIAAIPVPDTLKRCNRDNEISETIDRTGVWRAQTPQAAKVSLLQEAYGRIGENEVTDEASILEMTGIPVQIVEGSETNIKITHPDDLFIAEKMMQKAEEVSVRIGHGYDAHQFAEQRSLILGGIDIPYAKGLAGHSDADVLTHALCDAILGALGEGDLGLHFPDSDQHYKNIYSITLLEKVMEKVENRNLKLINADVTVVCEKPKLAPFIQAIKQKLALSCRVAPEQINVKATTTEKMGFTGRMEGMSCHAVVLLGCNNR